MPAQPQDKISRSLGANNKDQGQSDSSQGDVGGLADEKKTAQSGADPYSTLRADKVTTPGGEVMTDSKRSEMQDSDPSGTLESPGSSLNSFDQFNAQAPGPNIPPLTQVSISDEPEQKSDDTNLQAAPLAQAPAQSQAGQVISSPTATIDDDLGSSTTATTAETEDLPEGVKLVDQKPEDDVKEIHVDDATEPDSDLSDKDPEPQINNEPDPSKSTHPDPVSVSGDEVDEQSEKQRGSDVSSSPPPSTNSAATTLSDILVEMEVLDREKADEVKLAEVKTGNSQEEILTSQNLATEEQISKAKAKLYNVQFIDLSSIPVDPEVLNMVPQQVAEKFQVFPVSKDAVNQKLIVAMADPLNLTAIEFLEQRSGLNVEPRAADPSQIENLITAGYTTSLAKEVSEALKDVSQERSKVKTLDAGRTGLIREEKVAEVVTHILGFAVKSRASDVHIEPQEHATRVRYRIDGILQEKLTIPKELHDALVSRIKILSGMKIDEKRVPQDGRFNFRSDTEEVDLRVSTLPTAWGEKIVMRLLKKSGGIPELPELGLRGRALKNLQEAIIRPHGIILITGPTGSGKTTTLYSIIQKINTTKVNIMTLEDPIEYKIHGVNQVQANPGAGLTFASGMRSFLRQDPNIILVGEIRDEETAELAIQASLTGHLVFSTLHTNSAAGALPRLLDMGAEPYLLASSITAIVGQRVVRKIHQDCKTSYVPDPKVIDSVKSVLGNLWKPKPGEIKFYKGQGDQDCNNSGYLGRIGVFEVLPVSEKISRLILERAPSGDIDKLAREEGMITMKQDGYLKVVEGITTIEEVLRVAQE